MLFLLADETVVIVKRSYVRAVWLSAGLMLCISFIGCGAAPTNTNTSVNYPQLKVVGVLAGRFLSANNNQPPKTRADLVKFLDGIPEEWKGLGMNTAEEFLTSPRDGQPLVILAGKQFGAMSPSGLPWIAYEQTGIDGKVLVINARGAITEMKAEEIQNLVPQS